MSNRYTVRLINTGGYTVERPWGVWTLGANGIEYLDGSFATEAEATAEAARRTAEDAKPKKRTITLTDRPPVRINEDDWPVIAQGEWGDDARVHAQSNRGCDIRVRQHADGRAIVYGKRWSQWQGERGWSGGELLASGDDIVAAINRVAEAGGMQDSVARECIADLPAQEI